MRKYSLRGILFVVAALAAIVAVFGLIGAQYGAPVALCAYLIVDSSLRIRMLGSLRLGAMASLLDMVKLSGNDSLVGMIEEGLQAAPEMEVFPMRDPIRGTTYTSGVRTGVPRVSFRKANAGTVPVKSTFKQAKFECYILDALIAVDKRVAQAHEDGAAAYQAIEAAGAAQGAMRGLGGQIFYGLANTKADGAADGFPGLKAFLPKDQTTSVGDPLTVNATGTTANTASSVYAVKFGLRDAILVPGNGVSLQLSAWREQMITDPNDATKLLEAYVASLGGWIGLQLGNENCARRIINLTAETGKGLTDGLLADLFSTFPANYRPDAIFASRRSINQLQKARTVTLQGQGRNRPDQEVVAPRPTSYEGVPIVETDSILNTDAIE
jgi:hypothetical protein